MPVIDGGSSEASLSAPAVSSMSSALSATWRHRASSCERNSCAVLRDALGYAIALNRTLVLPRMLCYCDNIWKEMKHCRVGGAFGMTLPFDCPADHIINLPRWFQGDLPIAFREPGFLTDPRLAPAIKTSWVRVKTPPLTANEARAMLKPYAGARVIELALARDRFCGFEDSGQATAFTQLTRELVPYSRHFCMEDEFPTSCVGPRAGCVPFYAPCCGGAPGRHYRRTGGRGGHRGIAR